MVIQLTTWQYQTVLRQNVSIALFSFNEIDDAILWGGMDISTDRDKPRHGYLALSLVNRIRTYRGIHTHLSLFRAHTVEDFRSSLEQLPIHMMNYSANAFDEVGRRGPHNP